MCGPSMSVLLPGWQEGILNDHSFHVYCCTSTEQVVHKGEWWSCSCRDAPFPASLILQLSPLSSSNSGFRDKWHKYGLKVEHSKLASGRCYGCSRRSTLDPISKRIYSIFINHSQWFPKRTEKVLFGILDNNPIKGH